jgi:hypothetical protein
VNRTPGTLQYSKTHINGKIVKKKRNALIFRHRRCGVELEHANVFIGFVAILLPYQQFARLMTIVEITSLLPHAKKEVSSSFSGVSLIFVYRLPFVE